MDLIQDIGVCEFNSNAFIREHALLSYPFYLYHALNNLSIYLSWYALYSTIYHILFSASNDHATWGGRAIYRLLRIT
jgi:hypothetical protein